MAKLDSKDFNKYIPKDWLSRMGQSRIHTSGFRVLMPDNKKLSCGQTFDLDPETRVLLWFGVVPHLLKSDWVARQDESGQLKIQGNVLNQKFIEDRRENWLIIIKRLPLNSQADGEDEATAIAGFIAATAGPAWVYEKIFDGVILLPSGDRQGKIPGRFVHKFESTPTDTSKDRIEQIGKLLSSYANISTEDRNKIAIACHWFDLGSRASELDAFIYSWIALEAIAADPKIGDTKIAIESALIGAYGIDKNEVNKFMIGRLFGYRSKVFHAGNRPSTKGWLTAYLKALFTDVLIHRLNASKQNQAPAMLKDYRMNIESELMANQNSC